MKGKSKMQKDVEELSKNIKNLFLIYDHVRTFSLNIDEFNTSKIILTRDIKKKTIVDIFALFKNKNYHNSSKVNNKTCYFIDLMKTILSYDFIPNLTDIQLLSIYNLVLLFHKQTSQFDFEKYQKALNIYIASKVDDYPGYFSILKNIDLLKEDKQENTDIQFSNSCKVIQHLNTYEFNSSLSAFLLSKDSIPQYRNINFPKLDSKDDEKTYNEKIKNIANLLEIINSSLGMHIENIRYEIFEKYVNQEDKLKAINQVLLALNKPNLQSLSENNLEQNIRLQIEHNEYLKNENNKRNETIKSLKKEVGDYSQKVITLNENIQNLYKKLKEEEKENAILVSQLEVQNKKFKKLYDELQNIKYRDVCSYIIDYFVCLLSDNEYRIAMASTYGSAVDYVLKEIGKEKYEKYNDLLVKNGIIISDLFDFLLGYKFDFNSIVHDCKRKEEEEFIRLIKEIKGKKLSEQFESLFNETPLLRQFCFEKRNEITRIQIKNAILAL